MRGRRPRCLTSLASTPCAVGMGSGRLRFSAASAMVASKVFRPSSPLAATTPTQPWGQTHGSEPFAARADEGRQLRLTLRRRACFDAPSSQGDRTGRGQP